MVHIKIVRMTIRPRTLYSLIGFTITLVTLILTSLPSPVAKFIACDVGQGDAILITKGDTQVLVDGGPRGDAVLSCLSRHIPFWDRNIELVVFTNTDYDHLNGLNSVLPRYHIGRIVTGDGVGESDALAQFIDTLKTSNNTVSQVGQGDIIKVGTDNGLTFRVLWPKDPNPATMTAFDSEIATGERSRVLGINLVKNTNERSVVLELDENGYKVLLTGDAGVPSEQELLSEHLLPRVDLLKVAHHGSKYSSSAPFLATLHPTLAVISVGAKNTYGHPTEETLSRLNDIGATVRRTDQEGDIVVNLTKSP